MVLSQSVLSTAEQNAADNDGALIVPANLVDTDRVVLPFWNAGGLPGSTDITDATRPGARAVDNVLDLPFATTATGATTYFVNFELDSVEADTVVLKLLSLGGRTYDIRVQFATDAAFTDRATVAEWVGVTGNARLVQSGLDYPEQSITSGDRRFDSLTYGRIVFAQTAGSGSAPPTVGEIIVGRRRGLSYAFFAPWDNEGQAGAFGEFDPGNRRVNRYARALGFSDHSTEYTFDGSDRYGLDDLTTIRAVRDECRWGQKPVMMRAHTSGSWLFGYLSGDWNLPYQPRRWQTRAWRLEFQELPPFAARET